MKLTLSPFTRVSGLYALDLQLAGRRIVSARSVGAQFRGFELMLRGRQPCDAVYFTERICGICSTAHGYTASRLVESLCGNEAPLAGERLRQAVYAAEFLQNHLRHFYLLALPDYLSAALGGSGQTDSRFSSAEQTRLLAHQAEAYAASRRCHELLAVFGGKVPHQHGLVPGGVAVVPTADGLRQAAGLLSEVEMFIGNSLLPDAQLLAARYPDYHHYGRRPARFLSFGLFRPEAGPHVPAGAVTDGRREEVNPAQIGESSARAWYASDDPSDPVPAPEKEGGYSWVRAPRYRGLSFEGGPVARETLLGARPSGPAGTLDRILARAAETARLAGWLGEWLTQLTPGAAVLADLGPAPESGQASALNDAPRGALLHRAVVTAGLLDRYAVITPSTWNCSPQDASGQPGPVEEALLGTEVHDPAHPEVEVGRIVRAFDPCLSCATHVIDLDRRREMAFILA